MKLSIKTILIWLFPGPILALLISFLGRFALEYISPDKLTGIPEMIAAYPQGLLLSLLTPWGWLMYGGLWLMHAENPKRGVLCTLGGAVLLGLFWPIWATFLVTP